MSGDKKAQAGPLAGWLVYAIPRLFASRTIAVRFALRPSATPGAGVHSFSTSFFCILVFSCSRYFPVWGSGRSPAKIPAPPGAEISFIVGFEIFIEHVPPLYSPPQLREFFSPILSPIRQAGSSAHRGNR